MQFVSSRLPRDQSRRGPSPRRGLVVALLVALAAVVTAASPGCFEPQPKPELGESPDPSAPRPAARIASRTWRRRQQHTRGREGDDLFPCPSPDGTALYYSTSRLSPNFILVTRPLDGPGVSLLTDGAANDLHPAVSPDGSLLAFASDRDGFWDIYVLATGVAGPARRVVRSPAATLGPSWAPDGRRLACFRVGRGSSDWEIWIIDVETGSQTILGDGLFPAWSPDGEWIAFQRASRRGERWYSIWKVRASGGRATRLTDDAASWGAVTPAWSPDGRWIAFTAVAKTPSDGAPADDVLPDGDPRALLSGAPGSRDIYIIAADGGRLTNLTGDRPYVSEWNPSFGGDGKLYFNADEDGSAHVWSLDVSFVTGSTADADPLPLRPRVGGG